MAANRTMTVVMFTVVVLVSIAIQEGGVLVQGRALDGPSKLERLLSALSLPQSDTQLTSELSPSFDLLPEHPMEKRQVFDKSCKGVYSRSLFSKLNAVCDDCYNLYRKSHVSIMCKANCYSSRLYEQCVMGLALDHTRYMNMARIVQGIL
ncbi:hypothetical protein Pmani_008176 [Petrolisthes manimaculis]|uniref:Uncharacterized protein n=1 Tax=Petrolisthes manimaculis TaxID=1843537 RepID=A0AAE1Q7B9_9EUCA|nr:hypothetical protein Pmani_008176 [Petrolisthes manimaculis]